MTWLLSVRCMQAYFFGLPVLIVGTAAIAAFNEASSIADSSFKPALNSSLFLAGLARPSRRFFKVAICAYSSFGMVKLSRSIFTLLALGLSFSVVVAVLFTTLMAELAGATFFAATAVFATALAIGLIAGLAVAGLTVEGFVATGFALAGVAATGLVATGLAGLLVFAVAGLLALKGLATGLLAMWFS